MTQSVGLLILRALLIVWVLAKAPVAMATALELVCPCSAMSASATSVELRAGVRNIDTVSSGELRLRLLVHDAPSFFDSSFNSIAERFLDQTLAAGAQIAPATLTSGLVPIQRTGFSTLVLDELVDASWVRRDSIRLFEPVELDTTPGGALSGVDSSFAGSVYFAGTPTVSINQGLASVSLPSIVNRSPTMSVADLRIQFRQSDAADIFSSAFVIGSTDLSGSIGPGSSLPEQELNLNLNLAQGRFIHLLLTSGSTGLVYETVVDTNGSIAPRELVANSIELLADSDADGISDFNERFSGTDPQSAASRPGTSTIDLLVLYSAGVAAAHNGDALARIEHLVAVSNQIYQDSGVDIQVRLVLAEQRNLDESIGNTELINQMFSQTGAFADLQALKEAVGADIAIAMRPMRAGDTNCGIANLGAVGFDGDFSSVVHAERANSALYSDCRDRTTSHELGHIMGLNHSRVESAVTGTSGTFRWSTGHGVQNNFVTVMANLNDFGGFLAREVNVFSNPAASCEVPNRTAAPCGVARTDIVNGADAVASLNTTRFQVAEFTVTQNEFGDDAATALSIPVTDELITATFDSNQDVDFYAITALSGRTYRVETTQLAAGVDTQIEVIHEDITIAQDDNSGTGVASSISFIAANNGSHFIRVGGANGTNGAYGVRVLETSPEPPSAAVQLVAAVLPASRSVQLGTTATAFVTMINAGSQQARNCSIVPDMALPVDFSFQPTDPATNALIGSPNQAVTIDPGMAQTFLISVRPTQAFDSIDMRLRYLCDNSSAAAQLTGINTLRLSASEAAVPDMVALAATTTNDGVVHLPPGFFSLATVNVGSAGALQVSADAAGAALPVSLSICETNPLTGACVNPLVPAESFVTQATPGGTQTFAVFVASAEAIQLDPAQRRIFVRFTDESGIIRGSTSVAIQTDP